MPALAYDRKPEGKCIAAAAPGNYSPISMRVRPVAFHLSACPANPGIDWF
jgi:hypothetical protein